MKTKTRLSALALVLILVLALAACGASKTSDTATAGTVPEPAPTTQYSLASGSDTVRTEEAADTADAAATNANGVSEMPASDKIIYSGSATIETMEFDKTIEALSKLVSDNGGFVESSSVTGNDYYSQQNNYESYRSAQYVFRIPVDKFKPLMDGLDTLGNVPYSSTNAENITMQYTDTASRLEAAQTKETRLLELLSKASSMEDILAIENSLSDVRYEIESLTSQVRNWDSLISYSTLSITVSEVALYTEDGTGTLSYGQQLSEAFTRSIKAVGRFFKGFFKFLVAAFPVLVVLAVIAVPVILIIRAANKKKKAKTPPPTNFNDNGNNNPPFNQ